MVKLYLPRLMDDTRHALEDEAAAEAPPGGSGELILVVEDDEDVRAYSTETLRELGYRVLMAPNGPAGLEVLARHPGIRLLFTDVGLPGGMTGRQLADHARQLRPDLLVLFTTGYARNAIVHGGILDPGTHLLPKPFTHAGARREDPRAAGRLVTDQPLLRYGGRGRDARAGRSVPRLPPLTLPGASHHRPLPRKRERFY